MQDYNRSNKKLSGSSSFRKKETIRGNCIFMLAKIIFILSSLFLVGCASTAGPFVTNISSDGAGGLTIEKCMAKFDPWMSTIGSAECTSTNIKLGK